MQESPEQIERAVQNESTELDERAEMVEGAEK